MNFAHLHVHNEFSYLDGYGKAVDNCSMAKKLGFDYLALTNHGNVDGALDFQNQCDLNGIEPIQGCELYIVDDISIKEKGEKRKHITVLVKNEVGWNNLLKMLTIANLEGFYYRPRVSPDIVLDNCEGLIIMTACPASFITCDWGVEFLKNINREIPGDVYLEIMPHDYEDQNDVNRLCGVLSDELGIKLVATNDCHYIEESDSMVQEVLLAIQIKKKWKDNTRWRFSVDGLYMRTRKEMISAFRKQGELSIAEYSIALDNTIEIADKCKGFRIKSLPVNLPDVPRFIGQEEVGVIKSLCDIGMAKKVISKGLDEKIYRDRLDEELGIIIKQGFVKYFLIVYDLIDWCKSNDIMVGPGRGSSGGSLVSYCLNITEVDPIKYKLLFARFISPARIDLPDIDIDFEDTKRFLVREYLEKQYGSDCVAGVSTVSRLGGKGAIRDVSRVFDIPLVDVNKACGCIVVRSGGDFRSDFTIEDAFSTFEDGKRFKDKYPDIVRIAIKLEGQARTKGQHAAAIVISDTTLKDGKRACLQKGKGGSVLVNWDKNDCEYFGLMKLDALGINALTILNEARKEIKINYDVDIDYNEIELTDNKVFEKFSRGECVGCFQVGSLGLRKFCRQIGVENFMLLVHATSLYRPGTLRSGMATEFVMRKRGEKSWEHKHKLIERITKDTYGVILYQEQVMQFMYELGGLGWKTSDTVRKVISKSKGIEQFNKFKSLFADGCVKKKTLDRKTAEGIWDELSSFGSYGFNLSHAVEYSLITYWDMWLKVYYPYEFLCSILTFGSSDDKNKKKKELIEEAIFSGMDIRPPKIGISKAYNWIVVNNILYCPFIEIKGFGEKTALKVETDAKSLTKRYIGILDGIFAFDDIKVTEEMNEVVSGYFKFNFIKVEKFSSMVELINRDSDIEFSDIKSVDFNETNNRHRVFMGEMTEIKFGYRGALKKLQHNKEVAGMADNLGGVYGNFKDDTDFCMLVFDKDIYNKKKDSVEHCSGELLLVEASNPNRTNSLLCVNAWFEEEVFAGGLDGLNLRLKKQRRYRNLNVSSCDRCTLKKPGIKPVINSAGKYNIIIVGEYPVSSDNKTGVGFTGEANMILWNELKKYGYSRNYFNITNVVKCCPSSGKSINKIHIKKCSKWLFAEIDEIKPFLILALGNTCMKVFAGEDSGIMNKNGSTEWIRGIGAWVCWCINPASVLYHEENMSLFEVGIKNFVEKIGILG